MRLTTTCLTTLAEAASSETLSLLAGLRELPGGLDLLGLALPDVTRVGDVAAHHLSIRYAMDFREPAKKYCALGSADDVAETIIRFRDAGCRTFVLDLIGPYEERSEHLEAVAEELLPLLAAYRE